MKHIQQRHPIRPVPLECASVHTKVRANRHLDIVTHQPTQQPVHTAVPPELLEDQTHDQSHLLVRIDYEVTCESPHVTDRRVVEHLTTRCLVPQALLKTTFQDMQFRFTHGPFQAQQQPVVVLARIIKTVCVSQQGAVDGAQFQQRMPILARPRQPTHLQPKNQADPIGADFCQQPLKPASSFRRTSTVTLIFIDHLDRCGRPTQRDRAIDQGILPRRRLPMFQDLLLRRLPHVYDRQPLEMRIADLVRTDQRHRRIGTRCCRYRRYRRRRCWHGGLLPRRTLNRRATHQFPPFCWRELIAEPGCASVESALPVVASVEDVSTVGPMARPLPTAADRLLGAGGGLGCHGEPPCSLRNVGSLPACARSRHHDASCNNVLADTLISSGELIQDRA